MQNNKNHAKMVDLKYSVVSQQAKITMHIYLRLYGDGHIRLGQVRVFNVHIQSKLL